MGTYRARYQLVPEDDPEFRRFWDNYPKRVAKKEARKAWFQIRPTSAQVDQMVATLAWQCQQPAWLRDGGQYVPYPASWLRDERWEDEPVIDTAPAAFAPWHCPHVEPCGAKSTCARMKALNRPERAVPA